MIPNHQFMDVVDPDQASHLGSQLYFPMTIVPGREAPGFRVAINHARLSLFDINYVQFGRQCIIERSYPENTYVLDIPWRGSVKMNSPGGEVITKTETIGYLVSPFHYYWGDYADDVALISIPIRAEVVRRHEAMLTGRPCVDLPWFHETVTLSSGPFAALVTLVQMLIADLERPDGLWRQSPIALSRVQDAVLTVLLTAQPRHQHLEAASALLARPSIVRRVEAFMRQYAWSPLTLADLAEVAGVSGRTLQRTFMAVLGHGPMAHLRVVRLGLARDRLQAPRPDETVTKVALDCGYFHLGRFSGEYRTQFGERPSETLRRARAGRVSQTG